MSRRLVTTLLSWLLGLSACQSEMDMPAVTIGAPLPPVAISLPLPLATVQARLLQRLQSAHPDEFPAHPDYGPQFARFVLTTNERQLIDCLFRRYDRDNCSDEQPMSTAYHAPATVTAALLAYLALPVAARAHDVYLDPLPRWAATEYTDAQGNPLPYTCGYLLHLAALAADSTRLEVLAIDSNVVDGTTWGLKSSRDGLGLPWLGRVPRYRAVVPSLADQRQVLAQLAKLTQ